MKKRNFWLLVAFFAFLTAIPLGYQGSRPSNEAAMMDGTMASMMQHHLQDITLEELLSSQGMAMQDSMASHHQGDTIMDQINVIVTGLIVLTLPFIFGGLAILVILWL